MGGEIVLRRLVDRFYDLMDDDPDYLIFAKGLKLLRLLRLLDHERLRLWTMLGIVLGMFQDEECVLYLGSRPGTT